MIAATSSALSGRNFRVLLAGAMCRLRLPIFKSPSKEHWRAKTHASDTKPELLTLTMHWWENHQKVCEKDVSAGQAAAGNQTIRPAVADAHDGPDVFQHAASAPNRQKDSCIRKSNF